MPATTGRERPHDGHEARQHDRLGAVLVEEVLGAVDELPFEEPRIGAPQQARARLLADGEADLVADDGGGEAPDQDGGEVQLALVGEDPGGEQERVTGEEEADEQAGLGEDDQHQPDLAVRAQVVEDLLRIQTERENGREQVHDGHDAQDRRPTPSSSGNDPELTAAARHTTLRRRYAYRRPSPTTLDGRHPTHQHRRTLTWRNRS